MLNFQRYNNIAVHFVGITTINKSFTVSMISSICSETRGYTCARRTLSYPLPQNKHLYNVRRHHSINAFIGSVDYFVIDISKILYMQNIITLMLQKRRITSHVTNGRATNMRMVIRRNRT